MRGSSAGHAMVALMLACGCGSGSEPAGESADPPGFSLHDSAGVRVATTSAEAATQPLPWRIGPEPDLVIGREGVPEEEFFGIAGLTQLADGIVVVLDASIPELRFFGPDGRLVNRFGRRGSGPGEFQNPTLVPAFAADSLLVYDSRLRRFHLVAANGEGSRSFPAEGARRRAPIGVLGHHLFFRRSFAPRPTGPGVTVREVAYGWLDLRAGTEAVVDSVTVSVSFITDWRGGVASTAVGIPFTNSYPPAVVTLDETAAIADHQPEMTEYGTDGRIRRIVRVEDLGRPITSAVTDTVLDERAARTGRPSDQFAEAMQQMPLPATLPAFEALLVDKSGWVWAAMYALDRSAPTTWMVFDADRRARGTVITPRGFSIHEIGAAYVLGTWTDDMGVPQIRRYPLERHAQER